MSATPEHMPLIGEGGEIISSAPKSLDRASAVKDAVHNPRVASQAAKAPEGPAQVGMVEAKVAVNAEDADKAGAKAAADEAIATQLKVFLEAFGKDLKKRGLTIEDLGRNVGTWPATKPFSSKGTEATDAGNDLSRLPAELISEIGSVLSITDLNNLRLVSKRLNKAMSFIYGRKTSVTGNITIFPTFASISAFLIGIGLDDTYGGQVQKITLVGEGPVEPVMSYDSIWQDFHSYWGTCNHYGPLPRQPGQDTEQKFFEDERLLEYINRKHEDWTWANKTFCHSGAYRTMLSILLSKLPNLKEVVPRNLHPGEHVPGWGCEEDLKELSFYHPTLPINEVYYGGWVYDEKHKRVTMYTDEFGEYIEEDDVGEQVGFIEDVLAAMELSGTGAKLVC